MSADEMIDEARLIVLQPGDLIALEFSGPVTPEQAAIIKDRLEGHPALAGHDVLVLGGGARLSVVRPAT